MKALFFFTMLIAFSGLGCSHSRKSTQLKDILVPPTVKSPVTTGTDSSRNRDQVLKNKYSQYLRTVSDSIVNLRLYTFIDKWMNTPYRWGGTNHNGIDCSAFIQLLLAEVYTVSIPRTSVQQLYAKNIETF